MATDRPIRGVVKNKTVKTRTIKRDQQERYFELRGLNVGKIAAAEEAGVTPHTARKWEKAWVEAGNESFESAKIDGPRKAKNYNAEARRALTDFSYFQERYLGHKALPWQKIAADTIVKLATSPAEEYLVINCPPGSGKSTLMIHDIGAWMIARDRGIRICILSSTEDNAVKFADQLRNTLAATTPLMADAKMLKNGMGIDATTTLSRDFGRFKPETQGGWSNKKFRVEQPAGSAQHKEHTVEAFGRKQAFLGGRFDVVICDDVQDPSSVKTPEELEALKTWYSDIAESRLEQGGLMVMNMQRVGADDVSRYCLDMEAWNPEDDENVDLESEAQLVAEREAAGIDPLPVRDGAVRKYRHLMFQAHDDDNCKGASFHGRAAPAYPEGCLLFPRKLDYGKLQGIYKNKPGRYRLWYQQEEVDEGNILVEPVWISGGRDSYGIERQGCWDNKRGVREIPYGLSSDIFSFISVDPSPSQFWAVGWWLYHAPSKELYLIDLVRQKMTSAAFFDHNVHTGEDEGVLVDMIEQARHIGIPITNVIAEVNAAQKFMYQSSAISQYLAKNSIGLMPHTTTTQNKNSQEFGVQGLQTWFRDGRIRLPGRQDDPPINTRTRSMKLVAEVQNYKLDGNQTYTDDCVMQTWFATRAVDNLFRPKKPMPKQWRPSWMTDRPHLGIISA